MRLWKEPPDLLLSNEYQTSTRLNVSPYSDDHMEGAGLTSGKTAIRPVWLGSRIVTRKLYRHRNEIIRARQAIAEAREQHSKEQARRSQEISKRRLP